MGKSNSLVSIKQQADALIQRAAAYAENDKAPNTIDTYESLWRDFGEFCRRFHVTALPALPATVVAYLTELADAGQKFNTLETKVAAIRHFHREARADDPTADQAVRKVLDGIKRTIGVSPNRKAAIDEGDLRAMLASQPANLRGTRNRALLLVGYACALRRSELVGLDAGDIQFRRDRMIVHIRHSKTDPRGAGYDIHVPRIKDETMCPVHALRTWLAIANIKAGPLFRKVDQWENVWERRLTDQVVADIVKEAAKSAGIDPKLVAGHTLRRGAISTAAGKQHEAKDIRKLSRHKSEVMLDVYIQEAADAQMRVIGDNLGDDRAR